MFDKFWHDLWITLFVVLIIVGIFTTQGVVIAFGVMGLLVAGISWLWNRVSLERVSYERRFSQQRVLCGEEVALTITLTNKKPVPLGWVRVEDEVPEAVRVLDAEVLPSPNPGCQTMRHSTSMAWYERVRWEYHLRCNHRGFYRFGPVLLESGDLFGFFSSERKLDSQDYLLVYPRVVPLPELGIPSARPLGESRSGIRIFQDPSRPAGLRDYQTGDPLKTVDWKATARMQRLQVRTFEPSSTTTVILAVAIETTARYWEGYSPANLERVITTAASVATYAAERQSNLGLFSNGTPILSDRPMKIPPSRSPEQLTMVLEALATIRPLAMGPMATQLADHARRFPVGATIVLVAAFVSPELVEAIGSLRRQGHRVVVLYVGDGHCPEMPPGVLVQELQEHLKRMELASEFGPR